MGIRKERAQERCIKIAVFIGYFCDQICDSYVMLLCGGVIKKFQDCSRYGRPERPEVMRAPLLLPTICRSRDDVPSTSEPVMGVFVMRPMCAFCDFTL